MISAGDLTTRLQLQAPTVTRDAAGAETVVWSTKATVWARIRGLRGREYFDAKQVISEASHEITIRYRDGVSPRFRLLSGTRAFNILTAVDPDNGRESLVLTCKEVQA